MRSEAWRLVDANERGIVENAQTLRRIALQPWGFCRFASSIEDRSNLSWVEGPSPFAAKLLRAEPDH
ncbi:MAG: hypothetical protein ABSG21_07525 [Spirochaetia bacterium]|jgi:hypothetical protein